MAASEPSANSLDVWARLEDGIGIEEGTVHIYTPPLQRIPIRLRYPRLAKYWFLLPVFVGVVLLAFVSMMLFTPALQPVDGRPRDVFVGESWFTQGVDTSDAGGAANETWDAVGAANATAVAVEDSFAVDLEELLMTVPVELEPQHFWANISEDQVTTELPRT
ncbi:uncharacterized protein LOC142776002 [Rhipicephalus microplus]|uniref:uncharacterized protein LOC142776002 n=1 Tax=Rhipicephalus microplus TaxID=6941 RepID=UPI003F6C3164